VVVVTVAGGAGVSAMAAVAVGPAPVEPTTTTGLVLTTMFGSEIIRTDPTRLDPVLSDGMLRLRRRKVARIRALLLGGKFSGRAVTFMINLLLLLLVIVLVSIAMVMVILLLVVP
jgi:hypothetical protein